MDPKKLGGLNYELICLQINTPTDFYGFLFTWKPTLGQGPAFYFFSTEISFANLVGTKINVSMAVGECMLYTVICEAVNQNNISLSTVARPYNVSVGTLQCFNQFIFFNQTSE